MEAFNITDSEENYYQLLSVAADCSMEELTRAYNDISRKFQSDNLFGFDANDPSSISETAFENITRAYQVLKNPEERKKYDDQLQGKAEQLPAVKKSDVNDLGETATNNQAEPITLSASEPFNPENINPTATITVGFTLEQLLSNKTKISQKHHKQIKEYFAEKNEEKEVSTFEQAIQFIRLKKYDDAITILRELTETSPNVADYHSYLALAFQGKGWSGYAAAEFKVALYYEPDNKIALENLKSNEKAVNPSPAKKLFSNFFTKKTIS